MQIPPIRAYEIPPDVIEQIEGSTHHQQSFTGYNHYLKKLYKKGHLPTVKRGFYGDRLTVDNVSLEHLKPHSQGGETELSNLVLASKSKNSSRGSKPLKEAINLTNVAKYLKQFIDVQAENFDGNEYIKLILRRLGDLL